MPSPQALMPTQLLKVNTFLMHTPLILNSDKQVYTSLQDSHDQNAISIFLACKSQQLLTFRFPALHTVSYHLQVGNSLMTFLKLITRPLFKVAPLPHQILHNIEYPILCYVVYTFMTPRQTSSYLSSHHRICPHSPLKSIPFQDQPLLSCQLYHLPLPHPNILRTLSMTVVMQITLLK